MMKKTDWLQKGEPQNIENGKEAKDKLWLPVVPKASNGVSTPAGNPLTVIPQIHSCAYFLNHGVCFSMEIIV